MRGYSSSRGSTHAITPSGIRSFLTPNRRFHRLQRHQSGKDQRLIRFIGTTSALELPSPIAAEIVAPMVLTAACIGSLSRCA